MENSVIETYNENFLFRKRIFELEHNGIRVSQSNFINSEENFIPFEQLGPYVQFKSDLKLGYILISLIFISWGIMGLVKSTSEDIFFVVSISLIVGALYWIFHYLFSIQYKGSYFFSYSTREENGTLVIKSNYPASQELEKFINNIQRKQINHKKEQTIDYIDENSNLKDLLLQSKRIKYEFQITDKEYADFVKQITNKYNEINKKDDNKQ